MIRAQIARHVQPRTTDPNRVKLAQKPEFGRDQYVIRPLGLCDRAFKERSERKGPELSSVFSAGLKSRPAPTRRQTPPHTAIFKPSIVSRKMTYI